MSNKNNIHTTQVRLENATLHKPMIAVDTVWIPSTLAKVGKTLRVFSSRSDLWEDGWVVKEVYESKIYQEVLDDENNYKTQREASDSYDNQGPVATAFKKS